MKHSKPRPLDRLAAHVADKVREKIAAAKLRRSLKAAKADAA